MADEECTCPKVEERVEWIYTYGDMVTLLLTFFILLFAMSSSEKAVFNAMSMSFKSGPPGSPYQFSGMPTFMAGIPQAMNEKWVDAVSVEGSQATQRLDKGTDSCLPDPTPPVTPRHGGHGILTIGFRAIALRRPSTTRGGAHRALAAAGPEGWR